MKIKASAIASLVEMKNREKSEKKIFAQYSAHTSNK